MDIARIDSSTGEPPGELGDHFQGQARLQILPNPLTGGAAGTGVFAVHFQPGARTKPHVHPNGQLLVVVAGTGMVGDRDGAHEVAAGEVVAARPGEWHWHGAAPTTAMTHVTIQPTGPDSIDWDVDEGDWAAVPGYGEDSAG